MKKQAERFKYIGLMLCCMGITAGCASGREALQGTVQTSEAQTEADAIQDGTQTVLPDQTGQDTENVKAAEEQRQGTEQAAPEEEKLDAEQLTRKNIDLFLQEAGNQGIVPSSAAVYLETLLEDGVFEGNLLTGLKMGDIDGNGQIDMLVMVHDESEENFYGMGALWIYMNEDEPYCFSDEMCPYYGWFDVFWNDIDHDENVEIVFSAQGTGCGAVGDSYKAIFKYISSPQTESEPNQIEQVARIERMQLPSDFDEEYDTGLTIEVIQEPEQDQYTAYCPYIDEKLSFHAPNVEGWELPETARAAGGNARGFYNLHMTTYEGRRVLQASEYLFGEGGTAHYIGTAQFLISWKEDGTPEVIKWWIEENEEYARY